ncbi:aminotransferase-like domain-containing protein [Cellulosilyticum sp. I15G10I2]|uniref:aminotransferase-like domain-containing protein n=1 Tax=Cellulosilyticum sp. I15G10I2 TaxID=1892843 RepID=UPI00085BC515|nr:PLP-dependent aminotransferase family protein [Cellulosilyticum sp. I15G10I2]
MFYTVQLSKSDPTPLYIQLASEIAKLIQSGTLLGGTKLPPIRTLSKYLSINRDTVVSAYKLLENQGLVDAHVGKGTYVASQPSVLLSEHNSNEINNIYCSTLGFSKDLFPIALCKELAQRVIDTEGWGAFCDPLYRERNLLNQNVCCFLESAGIKASSAQVRVIKNFTSFLINLFKYSSKQGICIEQFSDLTYSSFLHSIGSKIYEIPLIKDGLNLEVLEKYLRLGNIGYIFLSSYLQNPTGLCYSDYQKQALIKLAKTYDCYIIEDGTLSEFLYDTPKLMPLFHHFSKDRVIYTYHFSKMYLPHLSYSFVLLPAHMVKGISNDLECTFNEYLLHYYLESASLMEHRKLLFELCKEKYNQLYSGLQLLKNKIEIYAVHGGIFFWLKPLTVSLDEICELFIQNNVVVSPGTLFTYAHKSDYFRLSITQLTTDHIDQILQLLHTQL